MMNPFVRHAVWEVFFGVHPAGWQCQSELKSGKMWFEQSTDSKVGILFEVFWAAVIVCYFHQAEVFVQKFTNVKQSQRSFKLSTLMLWLLACAVTIIGEQLLNVTHLTSMSYNVMKLKDGCTVNEWNHHGQPLHCRLLWPRPSCIEHSSKNPIATLQPAFRISKKKHTETLLWLIKKLQPISVIIES